MWPNVAVKNVNVIGGVALRHSSIISIAAICVVLTSCANTVTQGYEGSARSDDETALVRTRARSTLIISVDSPRGDPISIRTRVLRLLPRETCLGIEIGLLPGGVIERELCFEPTVNRSYDIERIRRPVSYAFDQELPSDVVTL